MTKGRERIDSRGESFPKTNVTSILYPSSLQHSTYLYEWTFYLPTRKTQKLWLSESKDAKSKDLTLSSPPSQVSCYPSKLWASTRSSPTPDVKTCHHASGGSPPNLRWPGPILQPTPQQTWSSWRTPQRGHPMFSAAAANYPILLFLLLGSLFYQAILFPCTWATQILFWTRQNVSKYKS